MNVLEPKKIQCPYCSETIDVVIDCSVEQQNYIEDCEVCCRPINFDNTMAVIERYYHFEPTAFIDGNIKNKLLSS